MTVIACHGSSDDEEDDNQWREDVIQCEEAVARLITCCPGFDGSRVLCDYYFSHGTGCGTTHTDTTNPALDLSESRCVLKTSCDDLVAKNICDKAQEATTYTTHIVTSDGSAPVNDKTTHPPVCK